MACANRCSSRTANDVPELFAHPDAPLSEDECLE